jgi:hypothetical protein
MQMIRKTSANGKTVLLVERGVATVEGISSSPPRLSLPGVIGDTAVSNCGKYIAYITDNLAFWLYVFALRNGAWVREVSVRSKDPVRLRWDQDNDPPDLLAEGRTGCVRHYQWVEGWRWA